MDAWVNSTLRSSVALSLFLLTQKANAIPAECDPNYVLFEDEIKCMELLKINRSSLHVGQKGKSTSNSEYRLRLWIGLLDSLDIF